MTQTTSIEIGPASFMFSGTVLIIPLFSFLKMCYDSMGDCMKRKQIVFLLILCLLSLAACTQKTDRSYVQEQSVIAGLDIEAAAEDPAAESDYDPSDIDLSEGLPASVFPDLSHASSEYHKETALCLLGLCSGHSAERSAQLFEDAGFTVLLQEHFDKAPDAPDHTCAYTVGMRLSPTGTEQYLIAIRGTNGGEWYSNFDIAPSQREDTAFAENFLFAAENIYTSLTQLIDFSHLPQIMVCGHSRGAACANLLGMLLDERYNETSVYTYTFATPMTIRPAYFENTCSNIFNIINPGDLVPRMPLDCWGYARIGTDIFLSEDEQAVSRADRVEQTLSDLAPDISSYYNLRHSLKEAGEGEDGLTAFELMELLSTAFLDVSDLTEADRSVQNWRSVDQDLSEMISDESDFAPLRDLFSKASADDGAAAKEVLTEHLPATYAALLG